MIFVFGSNLAGRHGKGAALYALKHKGAKHGQGEGLQGQSYALPTKDAKIRTRSLAAIERSVEVFVKHAAEHLDNIYLVTPVGCGLAGYRKKDIAPLFIKQQLTENIVFSKDWFQQYKEV